MSKGQNKLTGTLNILDEFVLLCLNERTGYFYQISGWSLNCAIIGAVLADLSINLRIDTDENSLFLIDSTKTGEPILDLCLEEIASQSDTQETRYWVERLSLHSEYIIDNTLKRLVEMEILTYFEGEFYAINESSWYAELSDYSGDNQSGIHVKTRIGETIYTDIIPSPKDSLIIGLLNACNLVRSIFQLEDVYEERVALICNMELISRAIATAVEQSITNPALKHSPATKNIPAISPKSVLFNRHLWNGNLPALFANLSEQYGPVFQLRVPFLKPLTFLAGANANRWVQRNSRKFMSSGNYFRAAERICGANNLLPSIAGADHFRMRKVMARYYSKVRFHERLDDMFRLSREFMTSQKWQAGSELDIRRVSRLMINMQMSQIIVSTDSQDLFEDLVEWNERAIMCYVANLYPKFLAHTPAMKRRFRLYDTLIQRIEQNHLPIERAEAVRELADELISLHSSEPQFLPEQNLAFMLAITPVFQSIYLGDLLGFTIFEMARHPEVTAKIREEANALFDGGDLDTDRFSPENYDITRRFIMECLRMYPIISMQLRTVANSCVMEDYALPLKEQVYIIHSATHYLSDCFPDPHKFDIDRYLPSRKEHRNIGYAPYALDTHTCAGRVWFNLQVAVNVLLIAHHFEFAPLPKDYKLKINPLPALTVSKKLKLRIANQLRELPS